MSTQHSDTNHFVIGRIYDLLLICFPFWIPLSYFTLISYFPNNNSLIFFIYLFILGETHFAATWLFFIYPNNRKWVLQNRYWSLFIPFLIIIALIVIAIKSIEVVLLFILIYNLFHVTRQSIGIIKIYSTRKVNLSVELAYIYIINILCAIVGLCRFIIPINLIIMNRTIISITIILFACTYLLLIIFRIRKFVSLHFLGSLITGTLLYLPLLFANTIQDAFAMGVGMHYSQYLALVIPINIRRLNANIDNINNNLINDIDIHKILVKIIIYLVCYSSVMLFFTFSKKYENYYYLIPVFFQLAHFYVDGFIWRFSEDHIRKNIGRYLFVK